MEFKVRRATFDDITELCRLLHDTWPDTLLQYIRFKQIIASHNHDTLVASRREHVIGVISCFVTASPQRDAIYELDLLAVDSLHRQQGVATSLVRASLRNANQRKISLRRALIRIGNLSSQKVFDKNDFVAGPEQTLMVLPNGSAPTQSTCSPEVIKVITLAYSGFWLEPPITVSQFNAAKSALKQNSRLGVVIPTVDTNTIELARSAGLSPFGCFRWWYHNA